SVVTDIRARIQHLDIAMVESAGEANVVVTLVRDRDLPIAIDRIYGRERARLIERSLEPQCLSSFRKDESFRIKHSDVIVVADAGDFIFYDCLYEEMLQALGPINDTNAVPWTMFNDAVQMGFFDIYDQYILNLLYDPRIEPGMDAGDALAMLPQIMPAVRAWVAPVNGLDEGACHRRGSRHANLASGRAMADSIRALGRRIDVKVDHAHTARLEHRDPFRDRRPDLARFLHRPDADRTLRLGELGDIGRRVLHAQADPAV